MMLKCYFSLDNIEIFLLLLLLSASRTLCFWSKQPLPHVGGAPKAKRVKVEIKGKDKGFFGNKVSLSLDFSSQYFARAKTTRGRLVSARVCPQIALTHTSLKVQIFPLAPLRCCQEAVSLPYAPKRVLKSLALADSLRSLGKTLVSNPLLQARTNFKTDITATVGKSSRCKLSSPGLHVQLNSKGVAGFIVVIQPI